jgi:hypothetical protein
LGRAFAAAIVAEKPEIRARMPHHEPKHDMQLKLVVTNFTNRERKSQREALNGALLTGGHRSSIEPFQRLSHQGKLPVVPAGVEWRMGAPFGFSAARHAASAYSRPKSVAAGFHIR